MINKNLVTGITSYLDYLKCIKNYSPLTIRNYSHCLFSYLEFIHSKGVDPEKITYDYLNNNYIQSFRAKLVEANKQAKTQYLFIISLRSFIHWYQAMGHNIMIPQALSLPKIRSKEIHFLTNDQITTLLSAITNPRDLAIVQLMLATGLRISETVSLNQGQIDLNSKEFQIVGKGGYSRLVFLTDAAVEALKSYLATRTDTLIPLFITNKNTRISTRSIQAMLHHYAIKAGLTINVTPHMLRHSMATHLLQEGADLRSIQEILGHRNIMTTQIYTHVTNNQLRDVYNRCQVPATAL